jgi:formylmethanofuran dehydrogenase subunit E
VLGVRLAMLGLQKLGIDDPRGKDRKRLVTFVEIDRCATDAVAVVTGCRLGKRALKFRDWGKVAATFVDVNSGKAIRIAAKESSKPWPARCIPSLPTRTSSRCWPTAKSPTTTVHHAMGESRPTARRISRIQR